MHNLILGSSESGKSCLAKTLVSGLLNRGKSVIVYDPIGVSSEWNGGIFLRDDDLLQETMKDEKYHQSHVFIDEAGTLFNEGSRRDVTWVVTRSRHLGHSVYLITQRAMQITKTARDQCKRLYCFQVSMDDAILLAKEYNDKELENASNLPQFHFYVKDRFSKIQKMKIDPRTRKIVNA